MRNKHNSATMEPYNYAIQQAQRREAALKRARETIQKGTREPGSRAATQPYKKGAKLHDYTKEDVKKD